MTASKLTQLPDADVNQLMEVPVIQRGRPARSNVDKLKQASTGNDAAPGSATAAATSATNASTSAGAGGAAGYASIAASKIAPILNAASTAATSATNAATSESQANTSKVAALASETDAKTSRDAAITSASNAATSAASADLAAQSSLTANQTAIAQATSAASWTSQDLSGINSGLHRSPNAITAAIVYVTSKDSDGGAWVERCADKSWAVEALNGNWLPHTAPAGWQSELDARAYKATLGSEQVTDPTFQSAANWPLSTSGTVGGGKVTFNTVASGTNLARQAAASSLAVGVYQVTVTVDSLTAGKVEVRLGANTTLYTINAAGTYTFTVSSAGGVNILLASGTTGATGSATLFSIKPVTAFTTKSGDFYQLATDGKFYRLWKNLLPNSGGIGGSGTTMPTGWNTDQPMGATVLPSAVTTGTFANGDTGVQFSMVGTMTSANRFLLRVQSSGTRSTVIGGQSYAFTYKVKQISGSTSVGNIQATLQWFDASNANISTTSATIRTVDTNEAQYTETATAPSNAVSVAVRWDFLSYNANEMTVNFTVLMGAVQLELGSSFTGLESKAPDSAGAITYSVAETFRGNKAKFPRLAAIVAEAANVTIYDLSEPGRPMWMRFVPTSATSPNAQLWRGSRNATSLAAMQGILLVGIAFGAAGDAADGVLRIAFAEDTIGRYHSFVLSSGNFSNGILAGNVALRNSSTLPGQLRTLPNIITSNTNAVAMTVLPNAPVDPVTGLQVPTIAVAVGVGNAGNVGSVIMNDGTVVNYSQASTDGMDVRFTNRGEIVWGFGLSKSEACVMPLATSNVATVTSVSRAYNQLSSVNIGIGGGKKSVVAGPVLAVRSAGGAETNKLSLVRENPSAANPLTAGLAAQITGTYNTGYMVGDIRRALMADTVAGASSGANKVTNGDFSGGTTGWSVIGTGATFAVNAGVAEVTCTASNFGGIRTNVTGLTPNLTYTLTARASKNTADAAATVSVGGNGLSSVTQSTSNTTLTALTPITFTAVATSHNVDLTISSASGNGVLQFDDVVVVEVVSDRSVKAKPASINSTLTKTAVAAAAQLVAWSGFSNDPVAELVSNGTFNTDLSGWTISTAGSSTAVWSAGSLVITGDGTNRAWASQALATVAGRSYQLTFSLSGGFAVGFSFGTSAQNASVLAEQQVAAATNTATFTAVGSTTWLNFYKQAASQPVTLDNVSVKAVGIPGSSANVLQEAFSADLDPGTGPLAISAWMSVPTTGYGPANFIRSSGNTGVVAGVVGSGGVPGNNWSMGNNGSGLVRTVVGSGMEGGQPYVDLRFSGTASVGTEAFIAFDTNNPPGVAAVAGQQLTLSVGVRLVAGDFTNVNSAILRLQPVTNSGSVTGASLGTSDLRSALSSATSVAAYRPALMTTIPSGYAGTTGVWPIMAFPHNAGAVDFTVRLSVPQIEKNATATPPIITSGTAIVGIAPIIDRSASTGSYYRCGMDGNGMLAAELYDGTTTRRVTSPVAYNNGMFSKVEASYDTTGTLALRVNGEQVAQTTGTALLTLTNANALLTLGNSRTLDAAFPGSIALAKIGMTLPTDSQSRWMYNQERQMFAAGAQVTLSDTGNVIDLAYDPVSNSYLVATAANEMKFNGLVRVSSSAIDGTGSKINVYQDIRLLARSAINPGVDIYMPDRSTKMELNRLAADTQQGMPKGTTQVFHFDAVTSQTDFVLPNGWTAIRVTAAGTGKREGSTKDWIRLFDGFAETVRFNAAPGNGVWVRILARWE